jgi:DNA-binding NtrC family response regulator
LAGIKHSPPVYVAVIEDEVDLAFLFRDALSNIEGIQVFAFSDPVLALEHFRLNHHKYAVIVSDNRMPIMSGLELLENIKNIDPSVTTIIISAFEFSEQIIQECQSVDRFLQKPVSMVTLIDVVESYINKSLVKSKV